MKVLLWHGYLLTGSGSNVLTGNVARSWKAAGHDVLVLCQDRGAAALDFVDAYGEMGGDGGVGLGSTERPESDGRCRVVRPDIGRILPVYVYDHYEGFEAKLFLDLTEDELESYVERNVEALVQATRFHEPQVILVGHEVMGPAIAREASRRTGYRYSVQLHGSGLEYAVKPQERYRKHAAEGLGGATSVIGGSNYMLAAARSSIGDWPGASVVVNPGCDVELFRPMQKEPTDAPLVAYVGKLITSKGVHNLLAALSLTRTRGIDCTIVGYGGFEDELQWLTEALKAGDLVSARRIASSRDDPNLASLRAYLQDLPPDALKRFGEVPVRFPGRLEHDALSRFLPTVDVLAVPSVVPEAFGMVAAEAAACGVLPVVPSHSGIAEAGAAIEEAIGRPGLLTYDAADPIHGLAAALDRVLDLDPEERGEMERRAAELARARWSWDVVGANLLRAAGPEISQ